MNITNINQLTNWLFKGTRKVITKVEGYKLRFPVSSGAPCALASLFTSEQHFLEMLFITL